MRWLGEEGVSRSVFSLLLLKRIEVGGIDERERPSQASRETADEEECM